MLSLWYIAAVGFSAGAVLAAPANQLSVDVIGPRQALTSTSSGINNGYYYELYVSNGDGVQYANGPGGEYSVSWGPGTQDFTAGKGWNPGWEQPISYNGTYNATGNAYLSVYGWTTEPLVEYYVVETFGSSNPALASSYSAHLGTVTSDGSTYDVYKVAEPNAGGSITGAITIPQYYSIRQNQRVGGTIHTANHFEAWTRLSLELGTPDYQIVAVTGSNSQGSAQINITSPATAATASTSR